jgi:hypothetical protein
MNNDKILNRIKTCTVPPVHKVIRDLELCAKMEPYRFRAEPCSLTWSYTHAIFDDVTESFVGSNVVCY